MISVRTRTRRLAMIAGVTLVALAAIVLAFDWNWLRGPLQRHLAKESGREVRIGALAVDFGFSLEPTIRLSDVFIENAPWAASKKPFVTAREIAIVVRLSSIFSDPMVVSRLVVNDGQIDMERRADGLRNWRLREPDYRGPGRVQVRTLVARGSSLQFVNEQIGLTFFASTRDVEATAGSPSHIEFKGRYKGRDFTGAGVAGPVVSFRESGLVFPVRGHIDATGTRLEVEGTASDVFEPGTIDVQAHLSGPSLSGVYPFLRLHPPASRAYWLRTRITHRNRVFRFEHIVGQLGGTPGTAEATYDRRGERPQIEARLHSDAADFGDVSPLIGLASPGSPKDGRSQDGEWRGSDTVRGTKPLPIEALRALDVKVSATATKLTIAQLATLENPRVEAVLRNGMLEAEPIRFRIAGGEGTATVSLDARETPTRAAISGVLRGVQLEQLVPSLADGHRASGRMSARMKLSGRGRSMSEIQAKASGVFETRIESGSISNRVDAKLGLNFGRLLRTFLQGDRDIAINCGLFALDVREGVGTTRAVTLDTADTRVSGRGTIDLRDQRIELTLTPAPKKPGLFTRRASINVRGSLFGPDVSIGDRVDLPFTDCASTTAAR